MKYKILFKECLRGKSLLRTLHNIYLKDMKFEGHGVDFGAKDATSSYYRFLILDRQNMTFTDLYSNNKAMVKSIDFENEFDLSDEKFDYALAFNLLEHIYNHKKFLANLNRSLKEDGVVEGFIPFMHYYHADPNDYFRYTHQAVQKILSDSGFSDIKITKIGVGGFTVSANMLSRIFKFKPLIFIIWCFSLWMDKILSKFWKVNDNIYCGLAFSAKK